MSKVTKRVLVTGAEGNLGSAVAEHFHNLGCHVIGTYRGDKQPSNEAVMWHKVDLLDKGQCDALAERLLRDETMPDAAVFCAGGFAMGDVAKTGIEDVRKMIALNFETAFLLSSSLFKRALSSNRPARYVFISSRQGLHPEHGASVGPYAISKGMVASWSRLLNARGRAHGILSYTLAPGTIDTPENRKSMPDADSSKWIRPEALAAEIAHLCIDAPTQLTSGTLEYYG